VNYSYIYYISTFDILSSDIVRLTKVSHDQISMMYLCLGPDSTGEPGLELSAKLKTEYRLFIQIRIGGEEEVYYVGDEGAYYRYEVYVLRD
jgi:hypothetical protein